MNKKLKFSLNLTGIALAVGQAFAPCAMAQEADPAVVVVSGMRASSRSALAIKKETMEVVDSITAEDIGKLPDPNVAETLTRIPGVQGYRFGGEGASPSGQGSGMTIRGLSNLTSSLYNGRTYKTAGSREYNIEGAIPGMIAGVDVFKNPSAEHIEGAIGGLINVRTRNPSDFKKFTAAINGNLRYNDLERKYDPELFGLIGNRFELGGGSRIGVLAAFAYQKSAARSDSLPANRFPDFHRIVRADSPEYATLAGQNTTNDRNRAMPAYVGRSDISYLKPADLLSQSSTVGPNTLNTAGLTPEQISNIVSIPTMNGNVFQESIMRERKAVNLAADYRVSNTLRFYTEANYNYFLYHQNYRFLWADAGKNIRNLQTTPFNVTESLANRNFNGGPDELITTRRVLGGTHLNSAVRNWGGDEHSPYNTWNAAVGAEWSPTPALSLKFDHSYLKSDRTKDNRRVEFAPAAGKSWEITRLVDGEPHQIGFNGPSVSDPNNFVFSNYVQDAYETWDDKGTATVLNGSYALEDGLFSRLKFGTRYAQQQTLYRNFRFGNRPLTTNGSVLAGDYSNAISVASIPGVTEFAPSNFMRGEAGFSGGHLVYSPDALLGNQVRDRFPQSNIPAQGAYPESDGARRLLKEDTLAAYLVGEFSAFDERLKGSVGVRIVRTESTATARVTDRTVTPNVMTDYTRSKTYTNALPTFNATYDLAKDFLVRFGFGRGMTRPDLGDLNPSISVDPANGGGGMGNPDLKPQIANSVDLSFERYFNSTNYVSLGLFNKDIKGFILGLARCMTVDLVPAYVGPTNGCTDGKYMVNQRVNAEDGYARGAELGGVWFFDAKQGLLKNFGVAGSITYVDTSNTYNMGSATAPRLFTAQQPFVSKRSYALAGMYEDSKLSGRLAYTWRSSQLQGNANLYPMNSGYMKPYGILDGSINYAINEHLAVSFNVSNILDKGVHRYVGEPGTYETGLEAQHMNNGRNLSFGLRYKF